jgi:glycosyltransferase involved in cell wall biosynthesis
VNPIRTGGGMRGKVLEAFACGCAVVSTAMGMEGVDAVRGEHCLLAETSGDFARAVLRYLGDPGLRRQHGRAARALAEHAYDPRTVFPRLAAELEALAGDRRRQVS